jgi:uncharacterized membrane protein YjjP (DUF1212 family)
MSDDRAVDPERTSLETALHTALEAGVRTQMSGGYTARVQETMQAVAAAMGAQRAEASVSSVVVGLTVHRGGWSRTAFQRTPKIGMNFSELSALSQLTRDAPTMAPGQIRERLDAIETTEGRYPLPLVLAMLGVACGAFAALFGADLPGILAAAVGGYAGAAVRHQMAQWKYQPFIFCLAAAFASTIIVVVLLPVTATPNPALAACVLYLVPGVPLLNGTADLIGGHYLNSVVRLTMSLVIILASGLGVALALALREALG